MTMVDIETNAIISSEEALFPFLAVSKGTHWRRVDNVTVGQTPIHSFTAVISTSQLPAWERSLIQE